MVEIRGSLSTARWTVLLQVLLCMLQVVSASGVATADRALLEMTLQDVTSAEGVLAQMALIGSLTRVCVTLGSGQRPGE